MVSIIVTALLFGGIAKAAPMLRGINRAVHGRTIHLDEKKVYVLGRNPDSAIVIDEGLISREHCRFFERDGRHYIEDLQSRNGTSLNGVPIKGPSPLMHGDKIGVAGLIFEYSFPEHAPLSELENSQSTILSRLRISRSMGNPERDPLMSLSDRMMAMINISHLLGESLDLEKTMPKVLANLFSVFPHARRGFIALLNPAGELELRWSRAIDGQLVEGKPFSQTITDQVLKNQEAVLSTNHPDDSLFDKADSLLEMQLESVMVAPLLDRDGNSIGVIQVDSDENNRRFHQTELEIMASIASQASIALSNHRLHQELLDQQAFEIELKQAQKVQQAFLPKAPPSLPLYSFFDFYQPAHHIGGDYYDYIPLPDGRLAVVIADVVGHGPAAAMVMVKLATDVKTSLVQARTAADGVALLNDKVNRWETDNRFVTMLLTVIDPKNNQVEVFNAGHAPLLLRKKGGQVVEVGKTLGGLPLGVTDDLQYQPEVFAIEPGDVAAVFTDGLNEAPNAEDQQFSLQRFKQALAAAAPSPEKAGKLLIDEVKRHLGQTPSPDDMCLITFGPGL